MRALNRVFVCVFMLLFAICFTAPAHAQCNSGFAASGFNGFSAFSGPVVQPFGFNGFSVQPAFGFNAFAAAPVNSVNFFAASNGHGHNRGFNANANNFNSFQFNGGRRGGFSAQSNGNGGSNTTFIRRGPFGRVRTEFRQSN